MNELCFSNKHRLEATELRLMHNETERLESVRTEQGRTALRSSDISVLHYLSYSLTVRAVMWVGFVNGLCFILRHFENLLLSFLSPQAVLMLCLWVV